MTNQVTVDKLLEMRLGAMCDAFLIQMNDSRMQDVLSFRIFSPTLKSANNPQP